MTYSPAIHALKRLHADLGSRFRENRKEATRLADELKSVEACLRLLMPGFNVATLPARRRNRQNSLFKKGEIWPLAVRTLAEAQEPLTGREICERVYRAKGVTEPTVAQMRALFAGVNSSLRNHAGGIVEMVGEDHPKRWRVIG